MDVYTLHTHLQIFTDCPPTQILQIFPFSKLPDFKIRLPLNYFIRKVILKLFFEIVAYKCNLSLKYIKFVIFILEWLHFRKIITHRESKRKHFFHLCNSYLSFQLVMWFVFKSCRNETSATLLCYLLQCFNTIIIRNFFTI